jgi:hypothetical protein
MGRVVLSTGVILDPKERFATFSPKKGQGNHHRWASSFSPFIRSQTDNFGFFFVNKPTIDKRPFAR